MKCPKCNHENEDGAMFCRHCGSSMNPVPQKESNTSSMIILIWIIAIIVFDLIIYFYRLFVDNWWEGGGRIGYTALCIIGNCFYILPALTIKNKTIKIIGIILSILLILWWIATNIMWALETYLHFD